MTATYVFKNFTYLKKKIAYFSACLSTDQIAKFNSDIILQWRFS